VLLVVMANRISACTCWFVLLCRRVGVAAAAVHDHDDDDGRRGEGSRRRGRRVSRSGGAKSDGRRDGPDGDRRNTRTSVSSDADCGGVSVVDGSTPSSRWFLD
jgi:hypothetical protein